MPPAVRNQLDQLLSIISFSITGLPADWPRHASGNKLFRIGAGTTFYQQHPGDKAETFIACRPAAPTASFAHNPD